ncbi:hypothetical protein [Pantoea latae]|uniref:Uncharacterized protein n=1 Tax=Pantoea latae TaxID=1964541 RepID=A0A1V9DEU4_9GAMM|nr:hypothetical protein [Pantoea latae]OQP32392.1 hypothetical protein B2J69_14055 [Pantoea latae]
MKKPNALTLKLDGTSPSKLPMAKLVKYMAALTDFYGSVEAVHFDSVSEGSADLNAWVDNDISYNAVITKATLAAQNNGSSYQRLTNLLEQDGFVGKLLDRNDTVIISFPTIKKDMPLYVTKVAEIQGRLYSVGGKDDSIPVRIEGPNGETFKCEATPELASSLGSHLFKNIRVKGESNWEKREGKWELKKMKIASFTLLKKTSLRDAISSIKQAPGDQWSEEEDADSLLKTMRVINCE